MSVPIKLLRPHTHDGQLLAPGATLRVSESDADWLIAHGIASRASPASSSARDAVIPVHKHRSHDHV